MCFDTPYSRKNIGSYSRIKIFSFYINKRFGKSNLSADCDSFDYHKKMNKSFMCNAGYLFGIKSNI